ncbi:MAG: hypothetical protein U0893_17880 [Chloroflexota bacterium]
MQCRSGTLFSIGLGLGVVVGIALGTVVALRLGSPTLGAMRGLLDRMSARRDQVHFELLLQ